MINIKDDDFIRGSAPMTKEDVRILTIAKLEIKEDDIIMDIGAGTGSLSIEAAINSKNKVYAIERKEDALELIYENKKKFKVDNLEIIKGYAPDALPDDQITKIMIGGSGGKMHEIFDYIERYPLRKVVVNTITFENTTKAIEAFKKHNYKNIEVVTANIAKSRMVGPVTMMMGQNPINIITGEKFED